MNILPFMKLLVVTKITTMIFLYWQLLKIFLCSADNWGLRVNNILVWTLAMYGELLTCFFWLRLILSFWKSAFFLPFLLHLPCQEIQMFSKTDYSLRQIYTVLKSVQNIWLQKRQLENDWGFFPSSSSTAFLHPLCEMHELSLWRTSRLHKIARKRSTKNR